MSYILHFYLPNSKKKTKFPINEKKKKKKTTGDIIIVHKCTKNHDHILYCSWDMVRDECNYFSFWAIFWPFTSITAQKVKISNKWKKHLKISSFNISVPKILIICFTVPGICCVMDVIIFHFGPFFALLPCPKNQNFKKMRKTPGDIILHKGTKNHDHMLYCPWYMAHGKRNFYISFLAFFFFNPFTPLTTWKMKISKCKQVHQQSWSYATLLLGYDACQV